MFVSSLSPQHLPPPPSALVATETADSGRVGGRLRALAALPHAVLSQYILASALLYGPDMLTIQVAQSDVIQLCQLHKGCLFSSL